MPCFKGLFNDWVAKWCPTLIHPFFSTSFVLFTNVCALVRFCRSIILFIFQGVILNRCRHIVFFVSNVFLVLRFCPWHFVRALKLQMEQTSHFWILNACFSGYTFLKLNWTAYLNSKMRKTRKFLGQNKSIAHKDSAANLLRFTIRLVWLNKP